MRTPEKGVYPIKSTYWKPVSNISCRHIKKEENLKNRHRRQV